ncbi:hypothetical protein FNV43_RR08501 [Rhamnella rubrinervis]|uniref:Uncharacterized protein n=1 Tax=Rhamnella rubrinervis TaxID=2594499 RepID=A0A8K0H8C3_9ROSA|nr:hypothetical protein FNV43_RR08501 [Rhamnella rubrinervis]
MVGSKENVDLASYYNRDMDPVKQFNRILSSCLEEQLQDNFSELQSVLKDFVKGRSVYPHSTTEPVKDLSTLETTQFQCSSDCNETGKLQKFELPKPVLYVGGYLLAVLLGRVQTQEIDGLYYICIAHVKVVGRPASLTFDVEMVDQFGPCDLRILGAGARKVAVTPPPLGSLKV